MTRLSLIRDFNLFPLTEKLLTLERKYGDSLNTEDLHGKPGKPKKKKIHDEQSVSQLTGSDPSKTAQGFSQSALDPNQTQQTAGVSTTGAGGMNSTQDGLASKVGGVTAHG